MELLMLSGDGDSQHVKKPGQNIVEYWVLNCNFVDDNPPLPFLTIRSYEDLNRSPFIRAGYGDNCHLRGGTTSNTLSAM